MGQTNKDLNYTRVSDECVMKKRKRLNKRATAVLIKEINGLVKREEKRKRIDEK